MRFINFFATLAITSIFLISGCKKDDTAPVPQTQTPTVVSSSPVNNAVNVAVNSPVVITFSEAMNPATINASTFTIMQGSISVTGVVTCSGTTAYFVSTANFEANKLYTGTLTTEVKSQAGVAISGNYTFSFNTGAANNLLPVISASNPENSITGVAVNNPIRVTFSTAMDPATINNSTFTLMQGSTSIAGSVTYEGTTAIFTPTNNLDPSKVYVATITTGVKDLSGHALGMNYTFTFTTGIGPDNTQPVISSKSPTTSATDVARNKVITLIFSEAMDPLTLNNTTFTLMQGTTAISGTVDYSGTTATFTPSTLLTAGLVYTATVTTGAKDLAGNALAANTVWSFTTGASTTTLAVVDLGTAANYVILAKTAINNISTSAVTGDLGLSPAATSYITGFALTNATGYATASQVTGKIYAADMVTPTPVNLTTAVNNMITAYNDAAGRPSPDHSELGSGNIGGKTLLQGLYKWSGNVTMPADVTLNGGANDVWIFQVAGNLNMSSAVEITLTGGAQAKNIFWQVAGQATIGTTAHFEGVLLSMTAITFQTGASMKGRALAQTAVILDSSTITQP